MNRHIATESQRHGDLETERKKEALSLSLERISIVCTDESKIQTKESKGQGVKGLLGRNPQPLFEPLSL